MIQIITTVLFSLLTLNANAEILSVDVEPGTSLVEVSGGYFSTGCSGSTTELPVIYSTDLDAYIVGRDLSYEEIEVDLTNIQPPDFTCQAEVFNRIKAQFLVSTKVSKSISISVQNSLVSPLGGVPLTATATLQTPQVLIVK